MKTAVMALSAASLFVTSPVFAQSVSSKAPHHQMRAKHKTAHPAYGYAMGAMQGPGTYGKKRGYYYYPGASGYAPTRDITEILTSGGGGGGGGGYGPDVTASP